MTTISNATKTTYLQKEKLSLIKQHANILHVIVLI